MTNIRYLKDCLITYYINQQSHICMMDNNYGALYLSIMLLWCWKKISPTNNVMTCLLHKSCLLHFNSENSMNRLSKPIVWLNFCLPNCFFIFKSIRLLPWNQSLWIPWMGARGFEPFPLVPKWWHCLACPFWWDRQQWWHPRQVRQTPKTFVP